MSQGRHASPSYKNTRNLSCLPSFHWMGYCRTSGNPRMKHVGEKVASRRFILISFFQCKRVPFFLATSRIAPNCVIAGTPPTFPNSASVAKLKPKTSQHKSSDLSMTRDLQEKERRLHKKNALAVLNLNRSSMIQSFSSEF